MIGTQGKRVVSIPVPHLEMPHFVHDPGGSGVGQGVAIVSGAMGSLTRVVLEDGTHVGMIVGPNASVS